MKYLIMLYDREDRPQSEDEQAAEMQRWFAYTDDMRRAGVHVAGEALLPSSTATTVRIRNDETLLTDGPFAETKEVLGGYYVVDVEDLDTAVHWAARAPSTPYGSTEVRPVMEFEQE
ncbi:YciI family protein [Salsipaludibacter albus]|uniref:YciI family protein n=1 Tax=Salsipaludibacter albus TaxID=2849650 RepID=UPI001EE3D033|nr:YciI family protein [Salsipaludibacter albus]MBY5161128.1 YciI family protein [Salsipaludibacter albus]